MGASSGALQVIKGHGGIAESLVQGRGWVMDRRCVSGRLGPASWRSWAL